MILFRLFRECRKRGNRIMGILLLALYRESVLPDKARQKRAEFLGPGVTGTGAEHKANVLNAAVGCPKDMQAYFYTFDIKIDPLGVSFQFLHHTEPLIKGGLHIIITGCQQRLRVFLSEGFVGFFITPQLKSFGELGLRRNGGLCAKRRQTHDAYQ